MKRVILLAALLGTWNESVAQTTFDIDEPLDSIRAPYSSEVTYSGVLQMETISAVTGKPALTGTSLKLPSINFISDSVLLFNLVGSKTPTTGVTISGVRGTFTATPVATSGWEQVAPWGVRKKFATPVLLPAGQFLGCRYDMPGQKISIESLAVTSWDAIVNVVDVVFGAPVKQAKITWVKVKGNLRCKVGMKAADIPAPVVAPPPPPLPVPDITPPVVSITRPLAGATFVGTNALTAIASDNVGVVGVQFGIDSANYGAEITAPPYTTVWNSTAVADGPHTINAVARDAAGNRASSALVTVTVSNAPAPPTPPGASPDGSSIPPLTQLVDETGAVWTQVGTHPLRNGLEVDGSGSILVTIKAGVIYFKQGDPVNFRWLRWAGNGWAVSAAP